MDGDRVGVVLVPRVAAEHEWWKGDATGPLDRSKVGQWRTEMPAPVQLFQERSGQPHHGLRAAALGRLEEIVPAQRVQPRPHDLFQLVLSSMLDAVMGLRQALAGEAAVPQSEGR